MRYDVMFNATLRTVKWLKLTVYGLCTVVNTSKDNDESKSD